MPENLNPCVGCIFNKAEYRPDLDPPGNLPGDLGYTTDPAIHRCQKTGQIVEVSSSYTVCLSRQENS